MYPWTLKGRRQVKIKTWRQRGGCPLISVLSKGGSVVFQIPFFSNSHILRPVPYIKVSYMEWVSAFVRTPSSIEIFSLSIYCHPNYRLQWGKIIAQFLTKDDRLQTYLQQLLRTNTCQSCNYNYDWYNLRVW